MATLDWTILSLLAVTAALVAIAASSLRRDAQMKPAAAAGAAGAVPAAASPVPHAGVGRYLLIGGLAAALLVFGLGGWAAFTELAGAVVAGGTVVVDSNVKKVQHPAGGVVGIINVKEGDHVKSGDLLIRLDETVTRANLLVITKQLDELAVRQARLRAEREELAEVKFPEALLAREAEPQVREIIASERALFKSRREGRQSLKGQLRERIAQLRQEVGGLEAQQMAKRREHEFARTELAGLEQLEAQRLVATTKITASRREVARLEGDHAQVTAQVAQTRGKIAEIELQLLQLDQDLKTEVGKDLREAQGKEAELSERRVAAEDLLQRIEIRAPQTGIVHQLSVHTIGGVITASEPIMLIVPDADRLVIEARLAPQDIDQVKVGMQANVRFTAFNQRTTPEVTATVLRISADLLKEGTAPGAGPQMTPSNAPTYYVMRLAIDDSEKDKLAGLTLMPGMPAEVHVTSGPRTAFSYFFKPVHDQFTRAFRER